MSGILNTILYEPIYNILMFIINNITLGDVGFAIILVTIIVKFALAPLSKKSIRSQLLMKKMEPELKQIKKDFPNKEEQAKKTFELYKKYGTNPFSGCLIVLIQIPVIFALYYVFYKGLRVDESSLYAFIEAPKNLSMIFLGVLDLSKASLFMGVLTGVSQFAQGYFSTMKTNKNVEVVKSKEEKADFQEQISESMQMNIKYILPIFVGFIAWKLSAAIALYWIVSNTFSILQELYIRRQLSKNVI